MTVFSILSGSRTYKISQDPGNFFLGGGRKGWQGVAFYNILKMTLMNYFFYLFFEKHRIKIKVILRPNLKLCAVEKI